MSFCNYSIIHTLDLNYVVGLGRAAPMFESTFLHKNSEGILYNSKQSLHEIKSLETMHFLYKEQCCKIINM